MLTYVPKWPLLLHFSAAVFCLTCSGIYHLFFVKSEYWRKTLQRLDYGGINILILGSSIPPTFYSFACSELHDIRNIFLGIITVLCLISFVMFFSETLNRDEFRSLRSGIFTLLGAAAAVPFIFLSTTR